MRLISEIRNQLSYINGALVEVPPEETNKGNKEGVNTHNLYDPDGNGSIFYENRVDPGIDGEGEVEDPNFIVAEHGAEAEHLINILGDEENQKIKQSVIVKGVEALGYYVSFHAIGQQWGVYINADGVRHLAREVFGKLNTSPEVKILLAFNAIYKHELFHFATDYMVSQFELLSEEAIWSPAKNYVKNKSPYYSLIEEKCANAWMLRSIRYPRKEINVKGKYKALRDYTRIMPAGYNEGYLFSEKSVLINELGRLTSLEYLDFSSKLKNNHNIHSDAFSHENMYSLFPRINWKYCPIFLVFNENTTPVPKDLISLFSSITAIQESSKFLKRLNKQPPLIIDRWNETKMKLSIGINKGSNFKPWPPAGRSMYSVRLDSAYRAHLFYDRRGKVWHAMDIGSHKSMGHG
jgi:hypothetical protein